MPLVDLGVGIVSWARFLIHYGEALNDLAGRLVLVHVRAGDTLFLQGDAADSLYTMLDGRLRPTASRADARRDADVYVHPDVDSYRLFEWEAIDRIVDEGYRATAVMTGWKPDWPA